MRSAVDYLIGQRLKRNGHMRWTREGANSLLQVRCAVLNGLDVRNFMRWYPPRRHLRHFRRRVCSLTALWSRVGRSPVRRTIAT
jgi:hypothetical protein